MRIESSDFRDALQPQDGFAIVITLLGIAIAIFLPDAIVKLIGACIALLGGIAFYMTLKARVNDRVQIRKKRTTLAPPSFKTHVSTDPTTSATRIRFDDFQETFHVGAKSDEPEEEEQEIGVGYAAPTTGAGPSVATQRPAPPLAAPAGTVRFDDLDGLDDAAERSNVSYSGSGLPLHDQPPVDNEVEGFRVVAPTGPVSGGRPAEPVEEGQERIPSPAQQIDRGGKKRGEKKRKGESVDRRRVEEEPPATPAPVITQQEELAPTGAGMPVGDEERTDLPRPNTVRRQVQMVLDELSLDSADEVDSNEPRAEFVRLVNQVLKAIARSIDSRSIIFCWMNLERGHFIPEAFVTRGEGIRGGERIKLANDLVSQIARGGVPEIVTNISQSAASELVPYYKGKPEVRSFVGVPVYFRHEVVGVLAADSPEEDGFDEASVATLAEYTILISQLIRSYAEKFDLYLMRQSIETFERLHASITGAALRPNQIASLLVENIHGMFDADYIGVILYDRGEGRWSVSAASAESDGMVEYLQSITPDMGTSVAGEAARRADEIYLPEYNNEIRISPSEQLPHDGSFLAIPLMAATKCYGSVVLGHRRTNAWVPRDIELLRDLVRYVAMAIEVVNTNEALEEQLVFDEQTGLYNASFFLGGLDREIDRARDFKTSLSLALIRVETPDGFASDRRPEISHISVSEVGTLLSRKLRPYDLLGRFDDQTFSIALIGRSDQEAYLWAERLRKEIAGHLIPFDARTFSITVSAGVCSATSSSDKSQVINGATQALEKATRDGGNSVVIY